VFWIFRKCSLQVKEQPKKNNSIRTYLIIYYILRIILVVPTTCRWFSPGPPVSSNNKTDRRDITEILLKVALNTIKQTNKTNHCPTLSMFLLRFIVFGLTRPGSNPQSLPFETNTLTITSPMLFSWFYNLYLCNKLDPIRVWLCFYQNNV
jgi:hypothetical protein